MDVDKIVIRMNNIESFEALGVRSFSINPAVQTITPTVNRNDNFNNSFYLSGSPNKNMNPGEMLLVVVRTRVNRQSLNWVRDDNEEMFIRLSRWSSRNGVEHHIVWNNYNDSRFNELANGRSEVTRLSQLGDNITINGNVNHGLGRRVRENVEIGSSPRLTGNLLTSRSHYSTMGIIVYNNSNTSRSVRIAGDIAPANQLRTYDSHCFSFCWCIFSDCLCAILAMPNCGCPNSTPQLPLPPPLPVSISSWVQHVYRQKKATSGRIVARGGINRIEVIKHVPEVAFVNVLDNYLSFSGFGNINGTTATRFSQFNNNQKAVVRDMTGETIYANTFMVNATQGNLTIDVEVRDGTTDADSILATRFILEIEIINNVVPTVSNIPIVELDNHFDISWQYILLLAHNQGMRIRDSYNNYISITQVNLTREHKDSIIDNQYSSFGNRRLYLYVRDSGGRRTDFTIHARLVNHSSPEVHIAYNPIIASTSSPLSTADILRKANVFIWCRVDGVISTSQATVYSGNYFNNYNQAGTRYVTFKVVNRQGLITRFTIDIYIVDEDINNDYCFRILTREDSGAISEGSGATLIMRNIEDSRNIQTLARTYLIAFDQNQNEVTNKIRIANEETFTNNIHRYGRFNITIYIYNSNGNNTYHTLVVYNNTAPAVITTEDGRKITVAAGTYITEELVRYLIIEKEPFRIVANSWPAVYMINFYINDFIVSVHPVNPSHW